jgi:hypothetical protein
MSRSADLEARTPLDTSLDTSPAPDPVVSVLLDITLTIDSLWAAAVSRGDETRALKLLAASRSLHEALLALSP